MQLLWQTIKFQKIIWLPYGLNHSSLTTLQQKNEVTNVICVSKNSLKRVSSINNNSQFYIHLPN